jgi:protein-S-isoprenylcysteine O-methyltransferase Ste14
METEEYWRRGIVFGSGFIYWAGVWVQAKRIRRHIGRAPNVKPRGTKERLLWIGWLIVVLAWLSQPWIAGSIAGGPFVRLSSSLQNPATLILGVVLTVAGYAGTLWCYAAMGDRWRMGINPQERTTLVSHGPYGFARHPIYSFQIMMLVGVAALLPSLLSLAILVLHLVCAHAKARDEESYLLLVHGQNYRDYVARTGRFWPRMAWETK